MSYEPRGAAIETLKVAAKSINGAQHPADLVALASVHAQIHVADSIARCAAVMERYEAAIARIDAKDPQ